MKHSSTNIYSENKIFTHTYNKSILLMKCTENEPSINNTRRFGEMLQIQFHSSKLYFANLYSPSIHSHISVMRYLIQHRHSLFLICLIIRTLVIRITNYPDRLRSSGKFVENSTERTCLEITGYRIRYSAVLWLLELQIRSGRKV